MSFVLMTIFTSFWTFLGTCVLLYVIAEGIATIIEAFKGSKQ